MKKFLLTCLCISFSLMAFAYENNKPIFINQVGFVPNAKKIVVAESGLKDEYVIQNDAGRIVYQGKLETKQGDFGEYAQADFSEFRTPGRYYIQIVEGRSYPFVKISYPFVIEPKPYDEALSKIVRYFSIQRCGDSTTGYNAPCHIDDGVRVDDNQRDPMSGGWHDASDLRKWMGATIFGMIGLAKVEKANASPEWLNRIDSELRWGNKYFLKMQEPEGYVMAHCAGDVFEHGDQNRWTDNIIGNEDDRLIQTDPLHATGQYNFIYAQALTAQFFKDRDPAYAAQCYLAAQKCWYWCMENAKPDTAGELGAAISAGIELMKYLDTYFPNVEEMSNQLLELQETSQSEDTKITGFFYNTNERNEPYKEIYQGIKPLLALCDICENSEFFSNSDRYFTALDKYCTDYLLPISENNAFDLVPFGLFTSDNGGYPIGSFWYRYFMRPSENWWVGINSNLASHGVGLIRASRLLNKPEYRYTAQRQLDWILGNNPFNASTVMDVGSNFAPLFMTDEFSPATPMIPGAVMNGIGGTVDDKPNLDPHSYNTCEYWTPMVGYTMWLMAELQDEI